MPHLDKSLTPVASYYITSPPPLPLLLLLLAGSLL